MLYWVQVTEHHGRIKGVRLSLSSKVVSLSMKYYRSINHFLLTVKTVNGSNCIGKKKAERDLIEILKGYLGR
jgi:hypothetical protein